MSSLILSSFSKDMDLGIPDDPTQTAIAIGTLVVAPDSSCFAIAIGDWAHGSTTAATPEEKKAASEIFDDIAVHAAEQYFRMSNARHSGVGRSYDTDECQYWLTRFAWLSAYNRAKESCAPATSTTRPASSGRRVICELVGNDQFKKMFPNDVRSKQDFGHFTRFDTSGFAHRWRPTQISDEAQNSRIYPLRMSIYLFGDLSPDGKTFYYSMRHSGPEDFCQLVKSLRESDAFKATVGNAADHDGVFTMKSIEKAAKQTFGDMIADETLENIFILVEKSRNSFKLDLGSATMRILWDTSKFHTRGILSMVANSLTLGGPSKTDAGTSISPEAHTEDHDTLCCIMNGGC